MIHARLPSISSTHHDASRRKPFFHPRAALAWLSRPLPGAALLTLLLVLAMSAGEVPAHDSPFHNFDGWAVVFWIVMILLAIGAGVAGFVMMVLWAIGQAEKWN